MQPFNLAVLCREEEAFEEGPGEAEAAEDPNREMTDEEFARRLYEEERQQSLRALYAAQGVCEYPRTGPGVPQD